MSRDLSQKPPPKPTNPGGRPQTKGEKGEKGSGKNRKGKDGWRSNPYRRSWQQDSRQDQYREDQWRNLQIGTARGRWGIDGTRPVHQWQRHLCNPIPPTHPGLPRAPHHPAQCICLSWSSIFGLRELGWWPLPPHLVGDRRGLSCNPLRPISRRHPTRWYHPRWSSGSGRPGSQTRP